jgi:RNA polymerase sigma factor (sigma-70 family)
MRWFAEEVRPHEPLLRAYLRRKFPALREVDDVIQESYLRVWRAKTAGQLRSAKAFLFTTARNAAFDLFRRRQIIPFEPLTEKSTATVYSGGASAADVASLNQELEILADAMRDLPDRCRRILLLRRIHGLSHKEIAAQLGISEHTVEKQVGIGLRKCVEYFKRRGVILERDPSP